MLENGAYEASQIPGSGLNQPGGVAIDGSGNLYIADIMDVDGTGNSRKPFGRVFYTKTKSLIFYAYDLDRQPGVKRASTFQVWGRTGSGDQRKRTSQKAPASGL